MNMNKKLLILGDKDPFLWALMRMIKGLIKSRENIYILEPGEHLDNGIITGNAKEILVLLNTSTNTPAQVNQWVWRELRLNDKAIGKEMAGLPVIVLGLSQQFLETPEGKVFRDFSLHHKYLTKPLNLGQFLQAITNICAINPFSLVVIKGDAPHLLTGALEHDLGLISKKFNFNGTDEEIKDRFRKVEFDLENYRKLQKNPKRLAKLTKEVKILKNEILKKRGNIWQ
jgi:hypothetical protein